LGSGQVLKFLNFVLATGDTSLTLSLADGTALLKCDAVHCFAGAAPSNAASLPAGFYLMGTAGGTSISAFDPWQSVSTLNLADGATLTQVNLMGSSMTGWRLGMAGNAFTFTSKGQLLVGDVPLATILANPGASVLADGPVLVREGHKGCPIPLPRPYYESVVLVYSSVGRADCDMTHIPGSFAYTVPLQSCEMSPGKGPFLEMYFVADKTGVTFFTDAGCLEGGSERITYQKTVCSAGWFGIFLPATSIMV